MRRKIIVGMLLGLAVVATGCGDEKAMPMQMDSNPIVINNINVDNYFVKGPKQQVFTEVPKKTFVVGENEIETVLALGVEPESILAVEQSVRSYAMKKNNWELFQRVNKCTSGNNNMEFLTKEKPDLIIAQQCVFIRNRLNNTEYWNERGINTLVPPNTNTPGKHIHRETVEKEMGFIEDLGRVFHKEERAAQIVADTYRTIREVQEQVKDQPKPRVMVVEFINAMISYDNTKLVGNMIEKIGGRMEETPAVIGFENVVKTNPDVLFVVCSHADYGACRTKITENPALRNLKCIKNKQVYSIPLRYTYGASCRTEDGIKYLAECIYPQVDFKFNQ